VLEQLSNAYALLPVSQWRGHRPSFKRTPPPAPHPDTCGAPSRLPNALAAAVIARRESGPGRAVLRELESDPTNPVAKALARPGVGSRGNALVFRSANLTEKYNIIAFEGDDHPKNRAKNKTERASRRVTTFRPADAGSCPLDTTTANPTPNRNTAGA